MSESLPVAIVGASGYSGAELIRLLVQHPHADLLCITSRQMAGISLGEALPRLRSLPGTDVKFTASDPRAVIESGPSVVFLALPHGISHEYAAPLLEAGLRVIDLSDDFRLRSAKRYKHYRGTDHPAPDLLPDAVYGLPEIHGDTITRAKLIACPGCYPTSILVPSIPLVRKNVIDPGSVIANSMSGVSGAGRKESIPLLYSECNESLRAYGAPFHRHLAEVEQELSSAARSEVKITFTPHLVPVTRGIATTITADLLDGSADIGSIYEETYGSSPMVRLLGEGGFPDTKNVTGTGFIDVGWLTDKRTNRVQLFSAEDNLGKGAAAQAVQCLNLVAGWPETTGLASV